MHRVRDYWPTVDWRSSSPQDQGMDATWTADLTEYVSSTRPYLNALLVIRHGYLVFEHYKTGYTQESYQVLNSVTKSFISALIGRALQDGYMHNLDQRLEEFLPDAFSNKTIHPYKKAITIRHLLKMTSGLYPDALLKFDPTEDWVHAALDSPTLSKPDQLFLYSSLSTHLLSVMLTHATGMNTFAYAQQVLFTPLGMHTNEHDGFIWSRDPQGYYKGGSGLCLKARDMAKFGYLYLNDGYWDNTQIVPHNHMKESTKKQTSGGSPEATNYGYLWWVTELAGYRSFFASGLGGQYIHVFPELDLIIVLSAPDEPFPGVYHRQFIPTVFLLPAIKDI